MTERRPGIEGPLLDLGREPRGPARRPLRPRGAVPRLRPRRRPRPARRERPVGRVFPGRRDPGGRHDRPLRSRGRRHRPLRTERLPRPLARRDPRLHLPGPHRGGSARGVPRGEARGAVRPRRLRPPRTKVAVASGKGGTGMATVAVSLARSWGEPVSLLDCDVEEPNDHLFLEGRLSESRPVTMRVPVVDAARCDGCGECSRFCAFHAIATPGGTALAVPGMCHERLLRRRADRGPSRGPRRPPDRRGLRARTARRGRAPGVRRALPRAGREAPRARGGAA